MENVIQLFAEIATYVHLLALLFCAVLLAPERGCLFHLFCWLFVAAFALLVCDVLREVALLSLADYSLYRRLPGRVVPALAFCGFVVCLLRGQRPRNNKAPRQ